MGRSSCGRSLTKVAERERERESLIMDLEFPAESKTQHTTSQEQRSIVQSIPLSIKYICFLPQWNVKFLVGRHLS